MAYSWLLFSVYFRGRSQTTLTSFWIFFWSPTPLHKKFLPYQNWHFRTTWVCTYPPLLVKVALRLPYSIKLGFLHFSIPYFIHIQSLTFDFQKITLSRSCWERDRYVKGGSGIAEVCTHCLLADVLRSDQKILRDLGSLFTVAAKLYLPSTLNTDHRLWHTHNWFCVQ